MDVKENLPIMILTDESPNKLLFEFKSDLWGYITLFISSLLAVASYFAVTTVDSNWIVNFIFIFFTLLFLYSSIYSFKLSRSLEIDNSTRTVNYHESSLYRNAKWVKDFQLFKLVKAFRPLSTATSLGGRKAINWSIQLVSNEGETFNIGYNQFGATSRKKAEALVNQMATTMSLDQEIIE